MPQIKTKSELSMHYERAGQGSDLVLIAGLASDHTRWSSILKTLSQNHKLLMFDNRGAGRTDSPKGPYTIEMMAKDTADLLDSLSIERASFIGHSMGGAVLQQLCLNHPEKVDKAVICASAARLPEPSLMQVRSVVDLMKENVRPELILETIFPWIYGEAFLKDKVKVQAAMKTMLGNPYPQTLDAFEAQVEACEKSDLRKKIAKITTKTLVIAGKEDLITPLKCSQFIHQQIPNSKIAIIEECGHMVQIEKSEIFAETVLSFLCSSLLE